MKQILLYIIFFLANLNLIKAQDVVINPNDVTLDTLLDFNSDPFPQWISTQRLETNIYNNTNSVIELYWAITQTSGPTEWQPVLFFNDISGSHTAWGTYSNMSSSWSSPLIIEADTSSHLDMRIRPYSMAGCGTFEVKVTPYSDTTNILTIGYYHFKINVDENCNELVATENFNKSTAKIFPNPTSDYFSITENPYVKSIEIFNIVGKQMAATTFQNGDAINISSFPNGLYLVRMMDDDGDVLKTTRLTKR